MAARLIDLGGEDLFVRLRTELIIAIFSDDVLAVHLFLKGGNALNLVHQIGQRTSLDIDCSMSDDFDDADGVGERLFRAIRDRLGPHGLAIFDQHFGPRPKNPSRFQDPKWGGYTAQFKVTKAANLHKASGDLSYVRRTSFTIESNPQSSRVFHIELSRFEYCGSVEEKILGGFSIHIYTPQAIAAEKLRSLCQQMPSGGRARGAARARDFYDIHALVAEAGVDLATAENKDLIREMFKAKNVPLRLLDEIQAYREFHRAEWPRVLDAIGGGDVRSFDYYFEFVVEVVSSLQALWIIDAP